MQSVAETLLSIVVAVLIYFAAGYAVIEVRERQSIGSADSALQQFTADAVAARPDLPESIAILEKAREQAQKTLTDAPTIAKRENDAATIFWGFYFLNTRARAAYCKERGVDIAPFIAAFRQAHETEVAAAKAIYRRASVNDDDVYRQMESMATKTVAQDMEDLAALNEIGETEACQLFADNPEEVVQRVLFAKVTPTVYETLVVAGALYNGADGMPATGGPSAAPTVPMPEATVPVVPAGHVSVSVSFAADSWAEIYDGAGQPVLYDLQRAGTQRTIAAAAPLSVTFGNAPGVTLVVNGRATALPPLPAGHGAARFTIAADGSLR